ncbi:hypothetical protein C7S18_09185 [Ahniella affigens]|uniref:Sel1 repeat family protein n=1 Tax=Ahniella affigens TaxID=2021234 RepID=A0A2P1PRA0_9GAMM|nr:tetratricopeptide repeat protein [Ahniella affigens]AVP97355.1 hypothetical protein C7S18_09185 [Ahniella affigens]
MSCLNHRIGLLLLALATSMHADAGCALPKPKPATEWRAPAEKELKSLRQKVKVKKDANQAREAMANLAVTLWVRSNRLESEGDRTSADAIRRFVRDQLPDTEWRIGYQTQNNDQGAAEAVLTRLRTDPKSEPKAVCDAAFRAAGLGSAEGQFRQAQCATDGGESRRYLEQAAATGHAGAQEALGRICLNEGAAGADCTTRWLCRAAQAGRTDAQSLLGWWLGRSDAPAADRVDAEPWLKIAAERGERAAMNNLGEWWERSGDVNQALLWYRKAADAGQPEAMVNVGRMLARSAGQCEQAAAWFDKAAAQGLSMAADYKAKLPCVKPAS